MLHDPLFYVYTVHMYEFQSSSTLNTEYKQSQFVLYSVTVIISPSVFELKL
jgi:hypothetical protein